MTDALVEAVARAAYLSIRGFNPKNIWWDEDEAEYFDPRLEWPDNTKTSAGPDDFRKAATAALQAIEAAGYRVVPVEATDRMSEACWRKASDVGNGKLGADQDMWSAMLSAAPRVGEG